MPAEMPRRISPLSSTKRMRAGSRAIRSMATSKVAFSGASPLPMSYTSRAVGVRALKRRPSGSRLT